MSNFLEEIIAHKKREVELSKERLPIDILKRQIKQIKKNNFYEAIKTKVLKKEIALIAEIKKASPSKGIIKKDFNHIEIAKAYKNGGATCLSVLTDEKYFQGKLEYIRDIKNVRALHATPLLRKDFIIDPYQIYESIYYGADCILLIVGALDNDTIKRLYEIAMENKIDALIEIHDEREMDIALEINPSLIGINNRDLKTFETNLNTTKNLMKKYKRDLENKIVVSESGIFTKEDIKSLTDCSVYAFLVGEGLIIKENIEEATKALIQ